MKPVTMKSFDARLVDESANDLFLTVRAESPAAAAIQVYIERNGELPVIVEFTKKDIAGSTLFTYRLSGLESNEFVLIEVDDQRSDR